MFEIDQIPGVALDDVQEVSNYVVALNHGVRRLREDFPRNSRLIRIEQIDTSQQEVAVLARL